MQRWLSAQHLARDERITSTPIRDLEPDPRFADNDGRPPRALPHPQDSDEIRRLVHRIFIAELEAVEGAGRTCFEFGVGDGPGEVPFEYKLDYARQTWDEARHCGIAARLCEWTGTAIGEFAEVALYDAAAVRDPAFRSAGLNRGLEGLAIDIFNAMREFARGTGDPVVSFAEDWMLADEVTHVKQGGVWLRRLTKDQPARLERALRFQKTIERMFCGLGARGDGSDGNLKLAKEMRMLAGQTAAELEEAIALAVSTGKGATGVAAPGQIADAAV